jgi:NAD(P)-dependent dehydrogenase (short-subunit alcohol dehydrogenase family)
MLALSNGLAKLTSGTDVTVNTILGGPTYSDGVTSTVQNIAEAQGISTEDLKAVIIGANQTSLLERFMEPDEIANLAVYLEPAFLSDKRGCHARWRRSAHSDALTGALVFAPALGSRCTGPDQGLAP